MSYFCHIIWKKDNPPNKLLMTVPENNPETKNPTKNKTKKHPKSLHDILLERNWHSSELLNSLTTTKKRKFASLVYQREMRTSFNELFFCLTCIDLSQLRISTSQNPMAFY